MAKKGRKQKKCKAVGWKRGAAGPKAVAEAEAFLAHMEESRRSYNRESVKLSPLQQQLVEQIEVAFADVQCLDEPYVMLCGEAMDDYMSKEVLDVLAAREVRYDWHDIPDDLLSACPTTLCFVGPEAYRFLIPRFMIGSMHEVVQVYPGLSYKAREELKDYERNQLSLLNEAQKQCVSDFLNLQHVNEETGEWQGRSVFLPWELDEYGIHYDEQKVTPREFGGLLVQRYAERVGLKAGGR